MPGVLNRQSERLAAFRLRLGHIGNTRHQEDARIAGNPVKKNLDSGQKAQKKPCFRVALPPIVGVESTVRRQRHKTRLLSSYAFGLVKRAKRPVMISPMTQTIRIIVMPIPVPIAAPAFSASDTASIFDAALTPPMSQSNISKLYR